MIKEYFQSRTNLIEGLITILILIWFLLTPSEDQAVKLSLIINILFLVLVITMFVFRNSNKRYLLNAFVFLILSTIADILRLNNLVSLTSSLTFCFLILGALNMIFFRNYTNDY